jgi:hypothetical protein
LPDNSPKKLAKKSFKGGESWNFFTGAFFFLPWIVLKPEDLLLSANVSNAHLCQSTIWCESVENW